MGDMHFTNVILSAKFMLCFSASGALAPRLLPGLRPLTPERPFPRRSDLVNLAPNFCVLLATPQFRDWRKAKSVLWIETKGWRLCPHVTLTLTSVAVSYWLLLLLLVVEDSHQRHRYRIVLMSGTMRQYLCLSARVPVLLPLLISVCLSLSIWLVIVDLSIPSHHFRPLGGSPILCKYADVPPYRPYVNLMMHNTVDCG